MEPQLDNESNNEINNNIEEADKENSTSTESISGSTYTKPTSGTTRDEEEINEEIEEDIELISAKKAERILKNNNFPYINKAIKELNENIINAVKEGYDKFRFERYYESNEYHIYQNEGRKISKFLSEKGFKNIKEVYNVCDDDYLEDYYKYVIEFEI